QIPLLRVERPSPVAQQVRDLLVVKEEPASGAKYAPFGALDERRERGSTSGRSIERPRGSERDSSARRIERRREAGEHVEPHDGRAFDRPGTDRNVRQRQT